MMVVGPTGRRVLLPARAGRTYPGPRRGRHPPALRRLAARRRHRRWRRTGDGPGRAPCGQGPSNSTTARRCLTADVVIGADGATSAVAAAAGLVDPGAVLWGFAQRAYVAQDVDRPIIALWDEAPGHGFPGYGWLFPGEAGAANIGLGLGLRSRPVVRVASGGPLRRFL